MAVFGMSMQYRVRGQDDEFALQRMSVAFERAGEGFENFGRKFFPRLSGLLEEEVRGQFDAEGKGPNRGHWKPLSEKYAAWKATAYPGQPLLVATGTMRAALTSENSPHALRVDNGPRFNFGTSGVPYASFHQTGTGRMPDRPPFDFTPALEEAILGEARGAAADVVEDSGLGEFVNDNGIRREVHIGRRGGRYYYAASGNRVYLKRQ